MLGEDLHCKFLKIYKNSFQLLLAMIQGKEDKENEVEGCVGVGFKKVDDDLYKQFFNFIETLAPHTTRREFDLGGIRVRYDKDGNYDIADFSVEIADSKKDRRFDKSYDLGFRIERKSHKDMSIEKVYTDLENEEGIEDEMRRILDNPDEFSEKYNSDFCPTDYPEDTDFYSKS